MAAFSKPRALITGISGFLGSNLAIIFRDHFQLVGSFCYHSQQIKGCQTIPLDLADALAVKRVIADLKPDVVIHTAALSHPNMYEQAPERAYHINVTGTENLLSCLNADCSLNSEKIIQLIGFKPCNIESVLRKIKSEGKIIS